MIRRQASGDSPDLVHIACVTGRSATRPLLGLMILRFAFGRKGLHHRNSYR